MRRNLMKNKAQNIIEYILLSMVVVVVLIAFLARGGLFAQTVNKVLKQPAHMMDKRTQEVTTFDSRNQ